MIKSCLNTFTYVYRFYFRYSDGYCLFIFYFNTELFFFSSSLFLLLSILRLFILFANFFFFFRSLTILKISVNVCCLFFLHAYYLLYKYIQFYVHITCYFLYLLYYRNICVCTTLYSYKYDMDQD